MKFYYEGKWVKDYSKSFGVQMTRKEEIKKAALSTANIKARIGENHFKQLQDMYIAGAEWADANPARINAKDQEWLEYINTIGDLKRKLADCEAKLNLAMEALEFYSNLPRAKKALAKIKGRSEVF